MTEFASETHEKLYYELLESWKLLKARKGFQWLSIFQWGKRAEALRGSAGGTPAPVEILLRSDKITTGLLILSADA